MNNKFLYNNPRRKPQRRYLRNRTTSEEALLWSKLRKKQLGYIFRRQYSIGPYIVDFYCPKMRLVVEIDGSQHKNNEEYDEFRTQYLASLGIKVARYWNYEIRNRIDKVLQEIQLLCTPPHPSSKLEEGVSPSKIEGD